MLKRLAFLLLPMAVAACGAQTPDVDGTAPEMVLEAYDVPEPYGPELVEIMRKLAGKNSANMSPTGQVLVAAPKGFQRGVRTMIASMNKKPPSPPPTLAMSYWLVLGQPSDTTAGKGSFPKAVQKALSDIEGVSGTMNFKPLDRVSITALSGGYAAASGILTRVEQTATFYDNEVVADLKMEVNHKDRSTTVRLPLDTMMVLGEAGYQGKVPGEVIGDNERFPTYTLFTIIQASIVGK